MNALLAEKVKVNMHFFSVSYCDDLERGVFSPLLKGVSASSLIPYKIKG